jgi:hypothetical protein
VTVTQADPALTLRRALDAGALFTRLAEDMCGEPVLADVERLNPQSLFPDEREALGIRPDESWAALRRAGTLVQSGGATVARVTSVVAVSRVPEEVCRVLTTTNVPLGRALGPRARAVVLWSSPGINEYAVHCSRLVLIGDEPVAIAMDRVLWSWLNQVS